MKRFSDDIVTANDRGLSRPEVQITTRALSLKSDIEFFLVEFPVECNTIIKYLCFETES